MILNLKRKPLIITFHQFLKQIGSDAMLIMACIAPVLSGLAFRFGIPVAEKLLKKQFALEEVLTPFYQIFDLFLATITPLMYCFIAAMVILGEIDDGISNYLAVTPLNKNGYLLSRLGIPMGISFIITIIILSIFSLTKPSFGLIVVIAFLSVIISLIEAMLVISLSTNKVEGMAVTKLTGFFIMGIPVPYFVHGDIQYILSILPSFWLSKLVIESKVIYIIWFLLSSSIWILFLYRKFKQKLK